MNVCVITYSNSMGFSIALKDLGSILARNGNVWLIVSDGSAINASIEIPNTNIIKIDNKISKTIFQYAFNRLNMEVKTTLEIIKLRNTIDIYCIFMEGCPLLPTLTSKLLRKKIVILLPSNIAKTLGDGIINKVRIFFNNFIFIIVDNIIIYSPRLIMQWDLEKYRHKILIARQHLIDFNKFASSTSYSDRPPLIGYIGRLSAEKGVQHFAQALPTILSERQDLRVLIGGDGQLKESIETSLDAENITARVDLPGWISRDDLPKYLNRLRLLVLPSYTEGLPNIMLEAMACGTPVLATPVGAIPDVIRDGETGFIMEDNSPECIARNVMRALSDPDLEGVAEQGRRFVEGEFTFEKAVERWTEIIEKI